MKTPQENESELPNRMEKNKSDISEGELKNRTRLTLRAAINDDATLEQKAYAARKLVEIMEEVRDTLGPENAGGFLRKIMDEEEEQCLPGDRLASEIEIEEILNEMEAQRRRLN